MDTLRVYVLELDFVSVRDELAVFGRDHSLVELVFSSHVFFEDL